MSPAQALKMLAMQERLERDGWRFDVQWLIGPQRWDVWAWHSVTYNGQHFTREDRTDALAHALQWADFENAEIEQPPAPATIPAPPPAAWSEERADV
jgi:hypothetical protein